MPNVIAAALRPKITWRIPEYSTLRPVTSVIDAPISNSPTALSAMLATTAVRPVRKKNANTGTIVPMINRTLTDVTAKEDVSRLL
jgi:hypothetical protein